MKTTDKRDTQYIADKRELLYNGSGYYDITAYKAMKGYEMDKQGYKDGDIVTIEQSNGDECEMLILKRHRNYATATMLKESQPYENGIAVDLAEKNVYIDCGRTGYVFYDKISSVEGFLPKETLDQIREKIAEATGLELNKNQKSNEHKQETTAMSYGEELELRRAKDELIKTRAERDIYKELYQKERGWKNET